MSSFSDFERELAKRTYLNYLFIKEKKDENDNLFEVTQLINSLLGIIISVKESEIFDEEINKIVGTEIQRKDWGLPESKIKSENLKDIVKHLRNAAAHLNITPLPNKPKEVLTDIKFESYNSDSNELVWRAIFRIEQLELFLKKITELIQES